MGTSASISTRMKQWRKQIEKNCFEQLNEEPYRTERRERRPDDEHRDVGSSYMAS